ncbi:hypothetical protein KHS38_20295 [Mucilaginibacter sp. Bleaf8]|uniref:hypothetical protein n=1 Tax=Mucilaginibacter sp. Bleaf8 TaxID=2834430 RepID=UPI001BCE50B7|nr:hypothetical protein [Mucilaginibacter sp. Bleaf8]MBS7566757.1 hypothetical protein [Mucilaginibacter sp. Bleaf8]
MIAENLVFPVEQTLPVSYLKSNFWKCNFTSAEKPLQYWILLPNNVKVINVNAIEHPELRLTVLGQYSTVDDSAYMEVQVLYEHIRYDLNPSDWLLKKLAIMGETILNVREIKGTSTGKYLDVLTYRQWPGGEEMISRFTVLKDSDANLSGANIFCVKASCLQENYNECAYTLLQIAGNWDFIHKSNWQMAELLYPFEYDFTEKVSFYVPESWDIKFETDNSKTFSRFLLTHDVSGENKGIINAHFYSQSAAARANEIYEKSFGRLSDFKSTISPLTPESTLNPSIAELCVATGTIKYEEEQSAAYLKLYILKTTAGWYYFEQVGPNPNLENDFWEVNKRAMEMIIDSFNNLEFTQTEPVKQAVNKPLIEEAPVEKKSWLPPGWKSFLE